MIATHPFLGPVTPHFVALFDESGVFSGIDHEVERGMRSLPETITPSRWEAGYRELSRQSRIQVIALKT